MAQYKMVLAAKPEPEFDPRESLNRRREQTPERCQVGEASTEIGVEESQKAKKNLAI